MSGGVAVVGYQRGGGGGGGRWGTVDHQDKGAFRTLLHLVEDSGDSPANLSCIVSRHSIAGLHGWLSSQLSLEEDSNFS
jgi:hypothetical protein